jgi:hypothetical protein
MAIWPPSLPQSLLASLTRKRQPGKIRSQMDTGPAKQRARFTAVVEEYEGGLYLTGAELTIFYTFYNDTLGMGAASFDWIDPVTDAAATLRFKDEPEDTLVRPGEDPDDRLYRVSISLEKLP